MANTKKKKKIVLWGNLEHPAGHERAIQFALEQEGYDVIPVSERNFKEEDILNSNADYLWFFKGAQGFGYPFPDLLKLLSAFTGKKVCWFFDKISPAPHTQGRAEWIMAVLKHVDLLETEDGEFVNSFRFINLDHLKRGADERVIKKGKVKKEFKHDVVFVGSIYGDRGRFVELLQQKYGDRFRVIGDVYGNELNDLYASAKVVVSPDYPMNDWYWSQRIYDVIARGGFIVHPRLFGLDNDFEEGKHYVGYRNYEEMLEKIDYYLENHEERDKIAKAGMEHVKKNHTYRHAVQNTLEKLSLD